MVAASSTLRRLALAARRPPASLRVEDPRSLPPSFYFVDSNVRRRWLGSQKPRSASGSGDSAGSPDDTAAAQEPPSGDAEAGAATVSPAIDASRFTHEIEVRMPDMGAGGKARIAAWHKREGDPIRWQEALCDVETPDFTFTMACEDEGLQLLGKILVPAPSGPVSENEVICTLLHEVKEPKSAPEAGGGSGNDTKPDSTA